MVENVKRKNSAITIPRMIKLNKKQPILIPPEFFENLKSKWVIMILVPSCGSWIIRTLATESPSIIKVKITYSHTNFLNDLGEVFIRNNIKTLYSTGLCLHQPPCHPFEGYIDSCVLNVSEDQLISELYAKSSIENVEITNVGT